MTPTLVTSCNSLPLQGATSPEATHLQPVQARAGGLGAAAFSPEGAARLRPGKAGSTARTGKVGNCVRLYVIAAWCDLFGFFVFSVGDI